MRNTGVLAGRSFSTQYVDGVEAVWLPLEAVARVARSTARMASFHEGEFMFMGTVSNARKRLDIHLYKHFDTRRYLNLDVAGHAYAFVGLQAGDEDATSAGRYRRYRSLEVALYHVGFWRLEGEPCLYRSFPPEAWPPDSTQRSTPRV